MIGLFGGTFNPIHYGHLRAAEEIRERFPLDKVVFIPACNPPLKRDALAQSYHRFEMTRLAVTGNPGFEVSDCRCSSDDASYTVNTIEEMRLIYDAGSMYFIMGADAFLEMPKWFKAEEILSKIALIVMTRPSIPDERIKESPYVDKIKREGAVSQVRLNNGRLMNVVQVTPYNISSTDIRRCVKEGRTIKYLLPESVESYIITNGLYK